MSEKMRCEQRDRMIRSARNSHHQDDAEIRHEFRDRERLPENELDRRFAGCGDRLSTSGYVSDVDRRFGERMSSSGFSSPLHSSSFSLNSSHSSMVGDDSLETLSSVSSGDHPRHQRQDQVEISEEMINFV